MNMYIDLPCQSCDRASIASARNSRIGDKLGKICTVDCANISTAGSPHVPKLELRSRGGDSTLLSLAYLAETGGLLLRSDSVKCAWPSGKCHDIEVTEKKSTTGCNRVWEWVPPCLLI